MTSISPDSEKKKRHRLTYVCLNCRKRKIKCDKSKPSCLNCTKYGVDCTYAKTQWVSRPPSVSEGSNNNSHVSNASIDLQTAKIMLQTSYTRIKQLYGIKNDSHGKLLLELVGLDTTNDDIPSANDILINFYDSYNTLSLKTSNQEDHKPLCHNSNYRNDPYISTFFHFLIFTLRLSNQFAFGVFQNSLESKKTSSLSKWTVLLDTKNKDSCFKETISRIEADRSELSSINIFPLITILDSRNNMIDHLKQEIIQILPEKIITERYLMFFFYYVWPVRPYLIEDSFKLELTRIISYDFQTGAPSLNFTEHNDLAILATFLIILRYSSTAAHLLPRKNALPRLEPRLEALLKHTIPVKTINLAKLCLSLYKNSKKTTINVLQAFMYLRCYQKDSTEDGDGMTLLQSQNLFGFTTQAALSMGLNRDPKDVPQLNENIEESNLRRRLWFGLVEIDTSTVVLGGAPSVLPDPRLINVEIPTLLSVDSLEIAQREELTKEIQLRSFYLEISLMINNLNNPTSLEKLLKVLSKSRNFIDDNYVWDLMNPLSDFVCGSRRLVAASFKNSRVLKRHLIQLSLELQVYSLIWGYFEKNEHSNQHLFEKFFIKSITATRRILDLTLPILLGQISEFVCSGFNFDVLPIVNTSLIRVLSFCDRILLRILHAQELVDYGLKNPSLNPKEFDCVINLVKRQVQYSLTVYKIHLANRYYTGLKVYSAFKYGFAALETYGIKSFGKVRTMFDSIKHGVLKSDPGKESCDKLKRLWASNDMFNGWTEVQSQNSYGDEFMTGSRKITYIHKTHSNLLAEISKDFIAEIYDEFNGPFKIFKDFNKNVDDLPADPLSLLNDEKMNDLIFTPATLEESSNLTFESFFDSGVGSTSLPNFEFDEEFFQDFFFGGKDQEPLNGINV